MATLRPAAYVGVASRCNAACSKLTCSESARMVGPLRQQSRTFRTSRIQRLDEDTDLSTLRKWDKMFEKLGLNTYKETFKQNLMTDRQLRQKAAVKRTKVFRAAAAESGIPFQKTEEEYNAFLKAKAAQRGVTAPEKAKPTSSPKGESVQVDSTKMVGAATAAATSAVDWDTSSDEATNGNHGNDSGERPLSPKDLHKQFQSPGYDVDPDMYDEDGYPIFDQSKTELAYEAAGKGAWYRELEQWAEDMDPKDAKRIYEEVWAEEAARKKGIEGKGQDSALGDGAESETGEMHEYGKDLEEVGASEDEAMKYREQYSYEEGEHDVSDGENKEKERLERKRLRAEARAKEAMEAKKEEMLGEEEDDFDIENDENMIEVEGSGDEDIGFSEDEQDEEAEHDLIEDHDFHPDLDMRLIETKRVVNQTGGGKIQSFVSIVAVGNGAGALGYSTGKSYTPDLSVDKAFRRAIRKLVHVRRYNDHTITHPIYVKFKKTRLYLRPSRVGHGTVAHEIVQDLCELAGVHDISSNIVGSTIPLNIVKAFFIAISKHRTVEDIAKGRGRNIVEFKRSVEVRG